MFILFSFFFYMHSLISMEPSRLIEDDYSEKILFHNKQEAFFKRFYNKALLYEIIPAEIFSNVTKRLAFLGHLLSREKILPEEMTEEQRLFLNNTLLMLPEEFRRLASVYHNDEKTHKYLQSMITILGNAATKITQKNEDHWKNPTSLFTSDGALIFYIKKDDIDFKELEHLSFSDTHGSLDYYSKGVNFIFEESSSSLEDQYKLFVEKFYRDQNLFFGDINFRQSLFFIDNGDDHNLFFLDLYEAFNLYDAAVNAMYNFYCLVKNEFAMVRMYSTKGNHEVCNMIITDYLGTRRLFWKNKPDYFAKIFRDTGMIEANVPNMFGYLVKNDLYFQNQLFIFLYYIHKLMNYVMPNAIVFYNEQKVFYGSHAFFAADYSIGEYERYERKDFFLLRKKTIDQESKTCAIDSKSSEYGVDPVEIDNFRFQLWGNFASDGKTSGAVIAAFHQTTTKGEAPLTINYNSRTGRIHPSSIVKALREKKTLALQPLLSNDIVKDPDIIHFVSVCGHCHNQETLSAALTIDWREKTLYFANYSFDAEEKNEFKFLLCSCGNRLIEWYCKASELFFTQYPFLKNYLKVDYYRRQFQDIKQKRILYYDANFDYKINIQELLRTDQSFFIFLLSLADEDLKLFLSEHPEIINFFKNILQSDKDLMIDFLQRMPIIFKKVLDKYNTSINTYLSQGILNKDIIASFCDRCNEIFGWKKKLDEDTKLIAIMEQTRKNIEIKDRESIPPYYTALRTYCGFLFDIHIEFDAKKILKPPFGEEIDFELIETMIKEIYQEYISKNSVEEVQLQSPESELLKKTIKQNDSSPLVKLASQEQIFSQLSNLDVGLFLRNGRDDDINQFYQAKFDYPNRQVEDRYQELRDLFKNIFPTLPERYENLLHWEGQIYSIHQTAITDIINRDSLHDLSNLFFSAYHERNQNHLKVAGAVAAISFVPLYGVKRYKSFVISPIIGVVGMGVFYYLQYRNENQIKEQMQLLQKRGSTSAILTSKEFTEK